MPAKRGGGADPELTRRRLLDAGMTTVVSAGFSGASARAIAAAADCNQASIYYHFGSVNALLRAAVVDASEQRLRRYREVMDPLTDLDAVLSAWQVLHAEDLESGYVQALVEMIGAAGAQPALREGVAESMHAWRAFIAEVIDRLALRHPVGQFLPRDDIASLVLSLFVGGKMMTMLDGDHDRVRRLFALGHLAAPFINQGRVRRAPDAVPG